eukprot:Rhum_TRINITY_DN25137_c0_g2::Rhum_TRINITY_DN25137_c0_g2_i1::g.181178::m.181178/K00288/MTHFD; methylenetetrahydrofolate dehydrogenase (NADP+) / methenyltetrahydrofolate cyclohydrolase / formyltetrahydrofolate synthetase
MASNCNAYRKEELLTPVPSDIEIAQTRAKQMLPIRQVATALGLDEDDYDLYGKYKAKVSLRVRETRADAKRGKYVVVAGINPTPLGEGKSTTTIGLAQSIGAHLNTPCVACVRQPSQGPTFGIKGGAAGGGYSQALPMEDFNLHGTGDIHAITAANNLLAAAIDARVFHERTQKDEALYRRLVTSTDGTKSFAPPMLRRLARLGIDKTNPDDLTPEERVRFARLDIDEATISWRRVTDVNDRMLRQVSVGEGPKEKGAAHTTGYDIAVASEVMAILALATDMEDYRQRLRRIVVAQSKAGEPITADDIGCAGAMLALLKDTIEPTLMQTLEGTPVFVHAGPFGNIAHGNSSVVADDIALRLVGENGFVLTEAGFGADMGGEKFCNIKCRASGLTPDAGVIVATVRALKFHAGKTIPQCATEDLEAVRTGFANLGRHIENFSKGFGIPTVVVLNRFKTDTQAELDLVKELSKATGAADCVISTHWANGGAGALDAAKALVAATKEQPKFTYTYGDDASLKAKIEAICTKVYGGAGVSYTPEVEEKLALFEKQGYGKFPICMAKTQYSFSHDPDLKGAPTGFTVPIRDVRISAGAGFVFPLLGEISTMPGLPTRPAYYVIDVEEDGRVVGLS